MEIALYTLLVGTDAAINCAAIMGGVILLARILDHVTFNFDPFQVLSFVQSSQHSICIKKPVLQKTSKVCAAVSDLVDDLDFQ